LSVGVAVIVEIIGEAVVFVPVKVEIFPVPLAVKPVAELLFVQFTVVAGEAVKVTAEDA
jgi:hypothetical protein